MKGETSAVLVLCRTALVWQVLCCMRPLTLTVLLLTSCHATSRGSDDDGSGVVADAGSRCPAAVPADGEPCMGPPGTTLACEYGGNTYTRCTTFAICAADEANPAFRWIVGRPDPGCGIQPQRCAATFDAVKVDSPCTQLDITCDYPEGACGCVSCASDGGSPGAWQCRRWSEAGAGCPARRPRAGTPCPVDDVICSWNQCCSGLSLGEDQQCQLGSWEPFANGGCQCGMRLCP